MTPWRSRESETYMSYSGNFKETENEGVDRVGTDRELAFATLEGRHMNFSKLGMTAVILASVGALAHCGSDSAGDENSEDVTKANPQVATSNIVGNVEAIQVRWREGDIMRSKIVAAPKRITTALRGLGLARTQDVPTEGAVKCMPDYHVDLLGHDLEPIASGGYCSETAGYIRALDAETNYLLSEGGREAIEKVMKQKDLLGDIFYGVRSGSVSRRLNGETSEAVVNDDAEELVGDGERRNRNAKLIENPPSPKCLRTYSVAFSQRTRWEETTTDVDPNFAGSFGFICGGVDEQIGKTRAYLYDALGDAYAVTIDGDKMRDALDGIIEKFGGAPVAPEDCESTECEEGQHCEMKGINGGSIPVCLNDEDADVDSCVADCPLGCPAPSSRPCASDGERYCNACVIECHGLTEADDSVCGG